MVNMLQVIGDEGNKYNDWNRDSNSDLQLG